MNKNWFAAIPANILYNIEISDRQKLIVAVIANLSNEKGYCFASNGYLAKMLGVTARTIQRDLAELENKKIISRQLKISTSGSGEYRAITVYPDYCRPPTTQVSPPHDRTVTPTYDTSVTHNREVIKTKEKIDFTFELLGQEFPPKNDNSGNPITLNSSKLEHRYMAVRREGKLKATFEQALVMMRKAIYEQDFEDQKHFENWFMVIAKDKSAITGKPKLVR